MPVSSQLINKCIETFLRDLVVDDVRENNLNLFTSIFDNAHTHCGVAEIGNGDIAGKLSITVARAITTGCISSVVHPKPWMHARGTYSVPETRTLSVPHRGSENLVNIRHSLVIIPLCCYNSFVIYGFLNNLLFSFFFNIK